MSGHDTHLAPLTDNTRAVTANHPTLALTLQSVHDPDLISLRDSLRDGDDQLDLVLDSFDDGIGGACWRDVDD